MDLYNFSQYKISDNNICIINSYRYKSKIEMKEILFYLKTLHPDNIVFTRSINSLIREWRSHNLLYKLGIARKRTKDVDLDYPQKWYYTIAYFMGSIIYYIIK